jgi:hypothetical protein
VKAINGARDIFLDPACIFRSESYNTIASASFIGYREHTTEKAITDGALPDLR